MVAAATMGGLGRMPAGVYGVGTGRGESAPCDRGSMSGPLGYRCAVFLDLLRVTVSAPIVRAMKIPKPNAVSLTGT